jgi:hypothetical protein
MLNLFLSVIMEDIKTNETKKDECVWYFLNFFLDTSIGILICYGLMKIANYIVEKKDISFLKSGFYFEVKYKKGKPRYKLKMMMYFSQLIVWEIIIIINKVIMLGLNLVFESVFIKVGYFILFIFMINENLELIMVMIVFPVIFNSIQFWIFDEILKLKLEPNSTLLDEAIDSDKQFDLENSTEDLTLELENTQKTNENEIYSKKNDENLKE